MLRNTIVVLLAVVVSIGISWLSISPDDSSGFAYFGPENLLYRLEDLVLAISQHLLPGFIIGCLLTTRKILAGAVVSALAAAFSLVFFQLHFTNELPHWVTLVTTIIGAYVYGSAGSALGRVAVGSNYAIKGTSA